MKSQTIWLVEDDSDDQELIRQSLSRCEIKHDLIVLSDGEEAVSFIFDQANLSKENLQYPTLIILDLKLSKLNGQEILKRHKESDQTKHIPVVIFTSSKEKRNLRERYAIGANAFVRKPIDFMEFKNTVKDIGTFWLLHNETMPSS